MLDRIGDEVARATSLVRYAPNSHFPAHEHGGGEEFLVLSGTFSDESGDFPAGTYVRNPPGTRHAPFTRGGCEILVKLRQMQALGESQLIVDITDRNQSVLYESAQTGEVVSIERLPAGAKDVLIPETNGQEIFVVEGSCF